jgi:hypothetical protein
MRWSNKYPSVAPVACDNGAGKFHYTCPAFGGAAQRQAEHAKK